MNTKDSIDRATRIAPAPDAPQAPGGNRVVILVSPPLCRKATGGIAALFTAKKAGDRHTPARGYI